MRVLVTGSDGFIGRHMMRHLLANGVEAVGLDRQVRESDSIQCDIRDEAALTEVVDSIRPTHVLNLAGDTDISVEQLAGYDTNTIGTSVLVKVLGRFDSTERLVHVSTQHVCRTIDCPSSDLHFEPDTKYAESKMVSELIVRSTGGFDWVLCRPTNIWGPGHPHLADGFWSSLSNGTYRHPSDCEVLRGYGYVENSCAQFRRLLDSPDAVGAVVYITDRPILQREWVDEFARALTGNNAPRAPRAAIQALAYAGEAAKRAGIPAPIHLSRYRSLTTSQNVPYERTRELCGDEQISLGEGVARTVEWLRARSS